MLTPRSGRRAALAALLLASAAGAQPDALTGTSQPRMVPIVDTIPPPADTPYPGTIALAVDATDIAHGIFRVKESIPVTAGPLTLLYPKWLPGNHSPSGAIEKLAGLTITANGTPIAWVRDALDVFAFHLDVPAGVTRLDVAFQFLSATTAATGRIMMTPEIVNLQWNTVALYPAGHYVRRILVQPTATYPDGWAAASALRPTAGDPARGGTIRYKPVAFDTLVDSPVFADRYTRHEALSPDVTLNMVADRPDMLAITPAQLAAHRAIVTQATKLYGARHYDHYDYLFALSDRLGAIGLEHHRSSENRTGTGYFTDWDMSLSTRTLLTHEYNHSWDGKFRRPADLWTPDYRTPMQGGLLWVYEGQDQFWGEVLAARAGLVSKQDALDSLAIAAAAYAELPGRAWRPLVDTTRDPLIAQRRPQPWLGYQRSEDYYREGMLIWLDADSLIRQRSGGKRSLDDFAKRFFGGHDGDWGELTYDFDDVVTGLNAVEPYDWAKFLHERIDEVRPRAPLDGITRGGYALAFDATPSAWWKSTERTRKLIDLRYSLGCTVDRSGVVAAVLWDGPAFDAGIAAGSTIVAVEGQAYRDEDLKAAITAANASGKPFNLLVKQGEAYRTVAIRYTGGLRYPHLVRSGTGPSSLDALFEPLR